MKTKKIELNVAGMSYKETLTRVSEHLINGGYPETLRLINREGKTR